MHSTSLSPSIINLSCFDPKIIFKSFITERREKSLLKRIKGKYSSNYGCVAFIEREEEQKTIIYLVVKV